MRVPVKKKRHQNKSAAFLERMDRLATDILSGVLSGVLTAVILKLLGW